MEIYFTLMCAQSTDYHYYCCYYYCIISITIRISECALWISPYLIGFCASELTFTSLLTSANRRSWWAKNNLTKINSAADSLSSMYFCGANSSFSLLGLSPRAASGGLCRDVHGVMIPSASHQKYPNPTLAQPWEQWWLHLAPCDSLETFIIYVLIMF